MAGSLPSFWTFDDPRSFGARTIVSGMMRGFQALGCQTTTSFLEPSNPLCNQQLKYELRQCEPEVLFFVNQPSSVYLASLGFSPQEDAALTIPRLIWILDDPFFLGDTLFGPWDIVLAADPGFIPVLERRGAKTITFLPVAADRLEPGSFRECWNVPVAYVGSVKVMSEWRAKIPPEAASYFDTIVQLRVERPEITFDRLLSEVPIQEGKRVTLDGPLAYYLYVNANNFQRIRMLEALVPLGLHLFGNDDWKRVLPEHSPLRSRLHPTLHPENDFPDLAFSASININLRSLQGFAAPTQRDFIVPGFGGFLLSTIRHAEPSTAAAVAGYWDGLESDTAASPEELKAKVEFWLSRPAQRKEWIDARRETIRANHTYVHRARTALEVLAWYAKQKEPLAGKSSS